MKKLSDQLLILIAILFVVPLGFISKFYTGPADNWINNSMGGFFYVIFWCLIVKYFFISAKNRTIVISVFAVTSVLEFLQLWHPAVLEYARSFFLGQIILGTTFNPVDFIYYFFGVLCAYFLLERIRKSRSS